MDGEFATKYRAMTARGNYLAQDRSDIRFAIKGLSRHMAKPRRRDWRKLVRFGKYPVGKNDTYVDLIIRKKVNTSMSGLIQTMQVVEKLVNRRQEV